MRKSAVLLIILGLIFLPSSCKDKEAQKQDTSEPVFTTMPSSHTGIDFINAVGDKSLAPEAGIDTHDQNIIHIFQDRVQACHRGGGVQDDTGLRAGLLYELNCAV